jgi:hypothetical protein
MRFMITCRIPVEKENELAKAGSLHHVCGTGTVVFKRQRKSRSTSFLLDRLCWTNVCLILTPWSFGIHPEALAT